MNPPSSLPERPAAAPRRPHDHEAHGVRREDPYHWMRDKLDPEAVANLTAERAYYEAATAGLQPLRDELAAEMRARLAPDDESVRWRKGGFFCFTRFLPGQEYPQLRRTPVDDPQGEGEVLLDENQLAAGHDYQEIGLHSISPDGRLLAYSVDHEGDEVYELRFRDLSTGRDLGDVVEHTYYTGAWSADSSTFFYTVNDSLYRPYQVWRHEVATAATSDVLVHQEDDEQFDVTVEADRSGEWIVVTCQSRDTSELWVVPAAEPTRDAEVLAPRRHGVEYSVAHAPGEAGGSWLVVTNDGAEEFRLMGAPVGQGGRDSWAELIGEDPDERLHAADVFARHLVLTLVRGAQQELRILPLDQVLQGQLPSDPVEVTSGLPGGLMFLGPNEEAESDSVLVRVESYVEPPAWFAIDLDTGRRELAKQTVVPSYEPAAYRVDRQQVTARDGVAVPVTIVRRSDVALDGSAPLLLYGYGAYESAWWPGFEPALASLLDRGVVFAHAHVRGGGEGGRRWWLQGRLAHKHHTFDDFIDVADALDRLGLVDGTRIVSRGLSAGGLLQGAVYFMRPDRWRAVVAEVPFVDVVTTMFDADLPLTVGEWDEWGDPRKPEEFAWLLAYSPYDNLPVTGRPDLLVTGALHDPRVSVHEPAKWVAQLRATDDGSGGRVLFRAETGDGGHTGPEGRYAALAYEAEVSAYVLDAMGLALPVGGQ
jgi:oligopeptidase B